MAKQPPTDSKLIGQEQIRDIEQFYRKWGDWAIVIARQIPGMRFPTFFFAGASAISLTRFYIIDGLAALITVNVFYWLGYTFADDLSNIKLWVEDFQSYASGFASTLILLVICFLLYRRYKNTTKSP